MKIIREEDGQSIMEFAVILPLIILLAFAPVDIFRVAMMKMNIDSACVEALNQVGGEEIRNGTAVDRINETVQNTYGDILSGICVDEFSYGPEQIREYDYYVYSSDQADRPAFPDRFEKRPSNYTYRKAVLRLSCGADSLTFAGRLFFGSHFTVKSDEVRKDIFIEGYNKEK